MLSRRTFLAAAVLSSAAAAQAQVRRDTVTFGDQPPATPPQAGPENSGNVKWRSPLSAPRTAQAPAGQPLAPVNVGAPRQAVATVTRGTGALPNDAGQEWRDYDISPYTTRVTTTARPEQAVLDWILRETGYEAWHTQPVALLSVDRGKVSAYHTPQMHAAVQEVVDRFVNTEAESHVFGMRVITLRSPDWRAKHHRMLHPIAAQTQGVQAWLLAKEDHALMVADLRRRNDFQEHSTPHLMVTNGQSKQISANQARNYIRDIAFKPDGGWPGYEPQMGQFDEGFKLEFSPLLSLDGLVVDAVLRCEIDQVEKMVPVNIDVSTAVARQHQRIEIPQAISGRLHERFRWPVDQVLLLSLGMGPTPVPAAQGGLSLPLVSNPTRSELLIFVESRGRVGAQPSALQPGAREANLYQNRYKIPTPPAGPIR